MAKGKKKSVVQRPWRQDFRDVKTLPDLKIVRTHFLMNLLVGIVLLVVTGGCIYQEYLISVSSEKEAELISDISMFKASDKRNGADSTRFMREVKLAEEAVVFLAQPYDFADMIVQIAKAQPDQSLIASLESFHRIAVDGDGKPVTQYVTILRGSMNPSEVSGAPQLIDAFVSSLSDLDFVKRNSGRVELVSSGRSQESSSFEYQMEISVNAKSEEGK